MSSPDYENRRRRLQELLAENGGKQSVLADRMKKPASYISRLLSDPDKNGHKNIGDDIITAAREAFNLPAGWFDEPPVTKGSTKTQRPGGSSSLEPPKADDTATPATFSYAGFAGQTSGIPVKKTIRVKADGSFEEHVHSPADGTVQGFQSDRSAYAVKVRGDGLAPAIKDGSFLVIEPHGKCVEGEDVVLTLKDGRMLCKQLLFERVDTVTLMNVNGGDSMITIERADIETMLPIAGVYPPSKWRPA
jgi:SOS-response transcriptional repressor LexA